MPYKHNLPDTLTPDGTLCVPLYIPNDPSYVSLLVGCLSLLTTDWYWERDLNNSAKVVRDIWQQETLAPLIEALANADGCGMSCEEIEACLTTSETIIQMNANIATATNASSYPDPPAGSSSSATNTAPLYGDISDADLSPDSGATACSPFDYDVMYGRISALVDFIVQTNEDLLERFEQDVGNTLENRARIIDAVPFINDLPFDDALEFTAWMVEELLEEYRALVDEVFITQIKCEIFCQAKANCSLNLQDVYDYFESKVSPSFPLATTTFLSVATFMWNGNLVGDAYFYYLTYLQLIVSAFGSYFGRKLSPKYYAMVARSGDPDNDWEIFCLDCFNSGSYDRSLYFTPANAPYYDVVLGTYNGTDAIQVVDPDRKVIVDVAFAPTTVQEIRVRYCRSNTRGADLVIRGYRDGVQVLFHDAGLPFVGCPAWYTWNCPDTELDMIRVEYYWNWLGDALTAVRLLGTGNIPFE